ncbi:acetyl-CoA acetyltransferase [Pseudohalioglobus lutimaris]|uniref:Acetyl-CoA acetyltransferase n=1 Tax=Pseudohalioglobus lutimaris TaxID=1737061 RepID=A0A2N5WZG8_9GAMM|nr:acetyl-CoA acetyltransferase [Pseudohalioglobus lutimaris]PLW67606.1 acetyl-CoA acetyltransferase [Pseudohalioglobus lutimaris]
MNPNTPVLVGVAAFQQHNPDFKQALEPVAIMERALRDAAEDAGCPALFDRVDEILVPKGIWGYSDPGRLLAASLAAENARSVLAEIGVSQQTLLTRACQQISNGEARVVLVTGAEAKYRAQCAARAGSEAEETVQLGVEPDVMLLPENEIWSEVESAAGLGMPVGFYAIMDSALRYAQGISPDMHRDQMAQMYQRFSEVAAANPAAWVDEPVSAETIRGPAPGNRMLAFPYTRLHNSQWNVDQGAGLIFCSVAVAEELGIARDRWIFPRAFAESNFMSTVSSRGELGGCPGFRIAGETAMNRAGVRFDDIQLRELYSCFPFAVRSQLHEFGMSPEGDLTVTGGMTFGGGPLNNFVYQATVRMAQLLREQPGEVGLVTTVSGMLTKQGVALWSAQPNPDGWVFDDVTEQVRAASDIRELVADYEGGAEVAGYTVIYMGDNKRGIAVFDLPNGNRSVAYSEDPVIIDSLESEECCGRHFVLSGGVFSAAS